MASAKRKKVVLSMEQKLEALKKLDDGETIQKVASEYGVGRVTVGDWRRKRSEIEKWCSTRTSNEGLKERKTMKKCEYEKVSEALYIWFTQQREKGLPVTGPLLQEKALHFQKEFNEGGSGFTASSGWLDRWKRRYGVRCLKNNGEKLSAQSELFLKFREEFHSLILEEWLSLEQIYNCGEIGLNYLMLPSKTLASQAECSTPGYKQSKEKVTVLPCSNAAGNHKLKLAIIGKYKKPQAFKNAISLPVWYKNQISASVNSAIFQEWFFTEFIPSVENFLQSKNLPRKAILVIDNASFHLNEDELKSGEIRVVFLPPNVTSLCQPMDQGVLEALKKRYRLKLLNSLVEKIEEGDDMLATLKRVNIKDVIYWISQAWEEIGRITLKRSWQKLLPVVEDENIQNEDVCVNDTMQENCGNLVPLLQRIPGCENANNEDIQEWMDKDIKKELTDNDIVQIVNHGDDDSVGDDVEKADRISHSDGVKALGAALIYLEQQSEVTETDLLVLQQWHDLAAKKRKEELMSCALNEEF